MTCFDRRKTTVRCLENLFSQILPENISLNVFLVDDGCTDGTGDAVKAAYPDVQVIQGTGDLFWCNGMRLAWEHAAKEDPDFYLWLNDDVQLHDNAVEKLLSCWLSVGEDAVDATVSSLSSDLRSPTSVAPAIIVGSTCDPETGEHTYGGQLRQGKHPAKLVPVVPQEVPVECDTFQGNIVLIPKAVYKTVGNMHTFAHAMGDTDYGLRAKKAGCNIFVAPGVAGMCSANKGGQLSEVGFRKSWRVLMRRLPPRDYLRFLWVHVGLRWPLYWARPYLNLIFSSLKNALSAPKSS